MKLRRLGFRRSFRVVLTEHGAQCAEMTIAPGDSEGGPSNAHRGSDQWLFVVAGRGVAIVGGRRSPLTPGTVAYIGHGERHEIRNTGRRPLKTLNFYRPPAYRRDGDPLPSGRPRGKSSEPSD